ncbi:MAG TPA: hypothetical protein VGD80_13255 [Kofleriaceae bacterium]
MPSQRSLFSLQGLAIATLVLTLLFSVALLALRPARVGPTPGIGDMKVDDALVVLRQKAKLVDTPLCHLLTAAYRCDPAYRVQELEHHIGLLNEYRSNVPEHLSSQTRKTVESTDENIGHVLDNVRNRAGRTLFPMILMGLVGALALWVGARRKAFTVLALGTATPFLLDVDELTVLVFCGYLGAIALVSLFVPDRRPLGAAPRARANPVPPAGALDAQRSRNVAR